MIEQDLRLAARSLRRAPGYTLIAVATVALGVAASVSSFSMVEGVLLRKLPYASGSRLIHIRQASNSRPEIGFSVPELNDLRAQSKTMDALVEYHSMAFQLYGLGDPQRLQAGIVSDNFFQVLGVQPEIGRLFRPGEEAPGADPVVLLSHDYWMNTLGGDPKVVGEKFTMNDKLHTIVGVLPPLPVYPGTNDIWMPAGACPFRAAPSFINSRTSRMPRIFARLAPGSSLEQANAELAVLSKRAHSEYTAAYPEGDGLHLTTQAVREEMTEQSKPLILVLFGTAVFLMLVAAANFAGLSVARQLRRGREFAVREALGAGRSRVFKQLAIESLIVSLIGGAVGTLFAQAGLGLLRAFATRVTPRAAEIQIDPVVLAFAVLTCIVVGVLAAAAPMLRLPSASALAQRLRQASAGALGGRSEALLRRSFVFAQVAMAFMLLVGAGLVGRSLYRLQQVDAGFDGHDVLSARVTLNFSKYQTNPAIIGFGEQLLARMAATPGLENSAIASNFPLNNAVSASQNFIIDVVEQKPGAQPPRADFTAVSSKYFDVMGVPVLRGRAFTAQDRDSVNTSIIISQRLATKYWGGRDPVGTRLSVDSGKTWNPVVGVAGDVHQGGLDQDIVDEVYYPTSASAIGDMRVLVRYKGESSQAAVGVRNTVKGIDAQQAVAAIQTLDEVRGNRLSEPRLATTLLGLFAIVALVLAATGLAGVMGYAVPQRIPEIAIRRALGANTGRIVQLVGADGLTVVVLGIAAGAVGARLLSRFVATLLFGVPASDVGTYGAVAALLVATAAIACVGPARRALAADPASAMRAS